jgi:hypothetical protein
MPFGILGLISATALGHIYAGVGLFAAAFLNRVIQCLAVGWGLLRDPRALRLCWIYPLRDLQGFLVWVASYVSHDFYWRGEKYRFTRDGKIIAQSRELERESTRL